MTDLDMAWRKFLIPDEEEHKRQMEALGAAIDNTTFHGTEASRD